MHLSASSALAADASSAMGAFAPPPRAGSPAAPEAAGTGYAGTPGAAVAVGGARRSVLRAPSLSGDGAARASAAASSSDEDGVGGPA